MEAFLGKANGKLMEFNENNIFPTKINDQPNFVKMNDFRTKYNAN